jgi:hypothetical protein
MWVCLCHERRELVDEVFPLFLCEAVDGICELESAAMRRGDSGLAHSFDTTDANRLWSHRVA